MSALEQAAKAAADHRQAPFTPGRTDAHAGANRRRCVRRARTDGRRLRNYLQKGHDLAAEHLLLDRACLLSLTAPELTVLIGGLRMLGANAGESTHGVFTDRVGMLTNDYFVNLLDMGTEWEATSETGEFQGLDRGSGSASWTGTRVDLSSAELRAAGPGRGVCHRRRRPKFIGDFVAAWTKVMNLDRFDIA